MTMVKGPALDPETVRPKVGFEQYYPSQYSGPCRTREWRALGDALGRSQFGVNLTNLPPGAWSAQRHWHMKEDEFVFVLEGEVVLITDEGEQVLKPGMVAGFPAGKRDGHHLINKSDHPVKVLEIGTRAQADDGEYPNIDMKFITRDGVFQTLRKNGQPF
jgi:uncharacterized cupin superfamily protein